MTLKQRFLKMVYPAFMFLQKTVSSKKIQSNMEHTQTPSVSFYSLQSITNTGNNFDFESLKGKFVLLVNTASECGYTAQYTPLEALHQQYKNRLAVIGFPANNFGGQEPGSDEEIVTFCQLHFGVTFPQMKKNDVVGTSMQPVYQWLTQPAQNGWNSQAPTWNFCKYLISPEGKLLHFFPAGVDPLDPAITKYLS
jgi:glutathione peroxidase